MFFQECDEDYDSDADEGTFSSGLGVQGAKKKSHYGGKKSFKFAPAKGGAEAEGGQIAGLRTATFQPPASLGKGFGEWEKHTRGIGAKLLLQVNTDKHSQTISYILYVAVS